MAEAETKLLVNGLRRPEVEELLWRDRDSFWRHLSDGLAIFLSHGFSVIYRLPAEFKELLVIANNFHGNDPEYGTSLAAPREQMPGGGDLAAILHYSVQPP